MFKVLHADICHRLVSLAELGESINAKRVLEILLSRQFVRQFDQPKLIADLVELEERRVLLNQLGQIVSKTIL